MRIEIKDAVGGFAFFGFEAQGFLDGLPIGGEVHTRWGQARKSFFFGQELDEVQVHSIPAIVLDAGGCGFEKRNALTSGQHGHN